MAHGTVANGSLAQGADSEMALDVFCGTVGCFDSIATAVLTMQHQLTLRDPFNKPSVTLRHDESNSTEVIFPPTQGADPALTEMSNFIDAVSTRSSSSKCSLSLTLLQIDKGPESLILSSYSDAAKTYELAWAVRRASEAVTRRVLARSCGPTQIFAEGGTGLDELHMCHAA
jgi:hypothetical protein